MLKNIVKRIIQLIEDNQTIFINDPEKALLAQAKTDFSSHQHINFYAIHAETEIVNTLTSMQHYLTAMSMLSTTVRTNPMQDSTTSKLATEIADIANLIEIKQKKLTRLQEKIPKGVLDAKRALYIAMSTPISHSTAEEEELQKQCQALQHFMKELNILYTNLISQGGSFYVILEKITTLYWTKLRVYTTHLKQLSHHLAHCSQLTPEGQLMMTCINQALAIIPPERRVDKAIKRLAKTKPSDIHVKREMLNQIGFSSTRGISACIHLTNKHKRFFHMPRKEELYHFDHDPTEDLGDTGGYCFGESILFMHSLSLGKFKSFCPEPGLINFQLDQTRELKFAKKTLAEAETPVHAHSLHHSLQWKDIRAMFIDNPDFKDGDICGIHLSMNEYTKSKRDFTPGHIAVVAKINTELSPYKYIVFEKDFGAFGLEDDESLEYIINHSILPLYEGMHYSKIKLVKYEEATSQTYNLIGKINPISDTRHRYDSGVISPLFFQTSSSTLAEDATTNKVSQTLSMAV